VGWVVRCGTSLVVAGRDSVVVGADRVAVGPRADLHRCAGRYTFAGDAVSRSSG
jgi:hypothetical protein